MARTRASILHHDVLIVLLLSALHPVQSFLLRPSPSQNLLASPSIVPRQHVSLLRAETSTTDASIDEIKTDLLRACKGGSSAEEVAILVRDLEQAGELAGVGQSSSLSGLLSGEWELVYASEDVTRSSPFFWAFRAAFPDSADQIYSITDSIPAPVKEVGPAFQWIDWNAETGTGRLVSKVKVATLGGLATSIMTTRCFIKGSEGVDGIRVKVETTKPEESTVLKTLFGPLGSVINENSPAFPSGEAFERVKPGSSLVTMLNTYCDEGLRICRYRNDDFFVWKRREFSSFDFL